MLGSVKAAVGGGMPALADAAAFYTCTTLWRTRLGRLYPMAGVIAGRGFRTDKLQRFGYIRLTAQTDTVLCPAGASVPGHEFHYWDSTQTAAPAPRGGRTVKAGVRTRDRNALCRLPAPVLLRQPVFCR
jgi:cobyrinic acid a,c-diamide synthase